MMARGSVRVLLNAAGAIATVAGGRQLFNYDAYGNAIGFNLSTAATTLLYNAQQTTLPPVCSTSGLATIVPAPVRSPVSIPTPAILQHRWAITNTRTLRATREVLSIVVFEILLSGVLQKAVDEDSSFEEIEDVLVTVEASPAFLCRAGQLEHHRQARSSSATSLGPAMA